MSSVSKIMHFLEAVASLPMIDREYSLFRLLRNA